MAYNKELTIAQLELVAAKAKSLAILIKESKLWEGELSSGLNEISNALKIASVGVDRNSC
jgi:hypothetical protein